MEEVKRKRGRPPKDGAMKKRVCINMDEDDKELLLELSAKTGESVSEFMRKAFRSRANLCKYQMENDDLDL